MLVDQRKVIAKLNYIQRRMYDKDLTPSEIDTLKKSAYFCVNNSLPADPSANIILGKLNFEIGDYFASRVQFNCAKKKNPNKPSIYYGLYKNHIMEGNWQEALDNLNIYIEMTKNKKRVDGFNIIIALLNYLTNQDINLDIPLDIYLSQEIKDKGLEEKYEELIDSITQGYYAKAINIADSCEEYSRSSNIYLEFLTLKKILKEVLIKYSQDCKRNYQTSAEIALQNKDYKKLYNLLALDIYNHYNSLNQMHYISILIENGYHHEVKELLNKLEFNKAKRKEKNIYRKIIREKELFDNYNDEQKEYYTQSLEAIENALLAEDYVDVYDMASTAYYKIEHPLFLYYLGISLFFLEQYSEAISYFVGYNRRGGMKALESRFFIACCHKNLDQRKQFKEKTNNYRRYCLLLNKKFHNAFNNYSYEPTEEEDNIEIDDVYAITNNPNYLIIKKLLKSGNPKEANAQIEKLARKKDKSPEDKKVLKYISNNKKIILNQNK